MPYTFRTIRYADLSPTLGERVFSRVEKLESGCWRYTGYKDDRGYGMLGSYNRTIFAHRAAWMCANRADIPAGMHICHSCDNTWCVNPDHLWLGTPSDNIQDAVNKGRLIPPGPETRKTKLTKEQVIEIRGRHVRYAKPWDKTGCSTSELAREFGVSCGTVAEIAAGRSWTHV